MAIALSIGRTDILESIKIQLGGDVVFTVEADIVLLSRLPEVEIQIPSTPSVKLGAGHEWDLIKYVQMSDSLDLIHELVRNLSESLAGHGLLVSVEENNCYQLPRKNLGKANQLQVWTIDAIPENKHSKTYAVSALTASCEDWYAASEQAKLWELGLGNPPADFVRLDGVIQSSLGVAYVDVFAGHRIKTSFDISLSNLGFTDDYFESNLIELENLLKKQSEVHFRDGWQIDCIREMQITMPLSNSAGWDEFNNWHPLRRNQLLAGIKAMNEKSTMANSLSSDLDKLVELYGKGLLTDEEFKAAKAKILN